MSQTKVYGKETPMESKSIFELLKSHFKDEDGNDRTWKEETLREFLTRASEILCYDGPKRVENEASNTLNLSDKSKKRKRRNFARLFACMGIPINVFGIDMKYLFPNGLPNTYHFLEIREPDRIRDFKKVYKKHASFFLNNATSKLIIYDYLGRGDRDVPTLGLKNYFMAHDDVYEKIEKLLDDNHNLKYIRILALHINNIGSLEIGKSFESWRSQFDDKSIGEKGQILQKWLDQFQKKSTREIGSKLEELFLRQAIGPNEILEEALKQCSAELFKHMARCLKKFGPKRCLFYVSKYPVRTYHYGLALNESKVSIYEEHYHLDKKGDAYTSFTTIQQTQCDEEWHFIYGKEIEEQVNDPNIKHFNLDEHNPDPKYDFVQLFRSLIQKCHNNRFSELGNQTSIDTLIDVTNKKITAFNRVFIQENSENENNDSELPLL